jgi:hypothetical protein
LKLVVADNLKLTSAFAPARGRGLKHLAGKKLVQLGASSLPRRGAAAGSRGQHGGAVI